MRSPCTGAATPAACIGVFPGQDSTRARNKVNNGLCDRVRLTFAAAHGAGTRSGRVSQASGVRLLARWGLVATEAAPPPSFPALISCFGGHDERVAMNSLCSAMGRLSVGASTSAFRGQAVAGEDLLRVPFENHQRWPSMAVARRFQSCDRRRGRKQSGPVPSKQLLVLSRRAGLPHLVYRPPLLRRDDGYALLGLPGPSRALFRRPRRFGRSSFVAAVHGTSGRVVTGLAAVFIRHHSPGPAGRLAWRPVD